MKITDNEIKYNNVKSAADLLSTEDMTAEQVKDIFDKLPELIAKKHNRLVDYVNEAVRSPESAQFDIQLFTNPAQFGTSYDAPMANIFAAMPKNSLALLNPSKCTDESWNLPYTSGVLEIKKSETRGKIVLWTRVGTAGDWSANFDSSNRPTGVWVKYLNDIDGSEISGLSATAKEIAEEAKQLGYDGINKANEAKAALDSLEADLGAANLKSPTATSVDTDTPKQVASITLPAGVHIIQFGGYFEKNSVGMRQLFISTSATPPNTASRQQHITQMAVDGKTTNMSCTTFVKPSNETTYYMYANQTSGGTLSFYGFMFNLQITGNTVVLPELGGGGSGGIFG